MNELTVVAAALGGLRIGLEADGYGMLTEWDGAELRLRIVAGSAACEDCLVPKQVMRTIAAQMLADGGISVPADRIVVVYPGDHADAIA